MQLSNLMSHGLTNSTEGKCRLDSDCMKDLHVSQIIMEFGIIHAKILRQSLLAWPIDAESEVASAEISCWSSLSLAGPSEPAARKLRSIRGARGLTWFHEIYTVMSTSALPVSGDCVVAPNCFDLSTDLCSTLQQDSCPSMHETCNSFCEEEADFLTELLVKQEAASQPIHLFPDDGAESSGTQAAMSDVSTTFGDWEADGVVPNLTCASSMLSSLQVPVKPASLMLQLDYSDVISAWEEMATDQKHPISQPLHQHTDSDQLITLHAPCAYTIPQSPLSALDALPNFPPSFSAPPRMSGRLASRSAPLSHMSGQCHSMMSAMSVPTLGAQAPGLVQQACAAHTVAEKTASLERYRAKKTTRQSGGSKIRYQIRKTNADNRLRFKGCFVKPSKLAELQMEAALNSECQDASSPMISGGSSESIFS